MSTWNTWPNAADATRNNHQGNPESVAAHESISAVKTKLRARVVNLIASRGALGCTSDEAEVALALSHQSVSARFTEAKAAGQIVDSGITRPTRSGRNARVYLVP